VGGGGGGGGGGGVQICNIFGVKFCKHLQLFALALVLLFKKNISPKTYGSHCEGRTIIMLSSITPSSPKLKLLQFKTPVEV